MSGFYDWLPATRAKIMNEHIPATQSHRQPPSKPPRIALNLDDDNDEEAGRLIVFECVAICDPEELAKIAPPRQP